MSQITCAEALLGIDESSRGVATARLRPPPHADIEGIKEDEDRHGVDAKERNNKVEATIGVVWPSIVGGVGSSKVMVRL